MNTLFTIVFLLLILWAVINSKHKFLVTVSILSVFADVFRVNIGPSLPLINIVGFFVIPFAFRFYFKSHYTSFTQKFKFILWPLWRNFLYLCLLGLLLGFIFPWSDSSTYRLWTQQAEGRTIISLTRYLNEFFVAVYFFALIVTKKTSLKFIVRTIGWVSLISISVAIIEFSLGPIFRTILQSSPNLLSGRFLGLNGEPKILGRNSALAYIIMLLYYLKVEKNRNLLLFIIVSAAGVLVSFSASAFIMFALFNIYLLIDRKSLKALLIFSTATIVLFFVLKDNTFFQSTTSNKIETALLGRDIEYNSKVEEFITRFDIFDHLALLYLYKNPQYIITGTGPNLISIPASQYLDDFPRYSAYLELGGIDSVPNVLFNNVLAASGIIGIFLYILFFANLYRFSKEDSTGFCKNLVVVNLIFNMVYFSIVLLFLTAIIIGYLCILRKDAALPVSINKKNLLKKKSGEL